MATTDPGAFDSEPPALSFWQRYHAEIWVAIFVLVAYGPAVANSIGFYFGFNDAHDWPMLGWPHGYTGAYLNIAFEIITIIGSAFLLVRPRDVGLFLPFSKPGRTEWQQVFWMAILLLFFSVVVRMILVFNGVPANELPLDDPAVELASLATDGITEPIATATTIVLMLRAQWSWTPIIAAIVTLHTAYHLDQGIYSIPPAMFFAGGFALLFLHYGRVGPLIAAHAVSNIAVGLGALPGHIGGA